MGMASPRDQNAFVVDREFLEQELLRIVDSAESAGVTVRVLGSIGVAVHCPDAAALLPSFERTYADIDFAAYGRQARDLAKVMTGLGYLDDRDMYITSEGRRSIFMSPVRQVHIDVFYDRLEFSHTIPIGGRLAADRPTLPLAELLLSKLQIAKINTKDVIDIALLLLGHRLGSGDDDVIDKGRVAGLCAAEWGLWRTVTLNLEKVDGLARTWPQLTDDQRGRIETAIVELRRAIDDAPKPLAWRMRARIGDRRQWWTDVDEVR